MSYRIGSGFKGSTGIIISLASEEVIPDAPVEWTYPRYTFYRFEFMNREACTVKINGDANSIFLDAYQGFTSEITDIPISSFIITEADIRYNFVGWY